MEGVNKKLLWATIILAALLICILSFLAGSYFGRRSSAVPANTGTTNTPAQSGTPSGTSQAQGRTPKEILLGQMFWTDPDGNVGLAVNSETDIRLLMNGETFELEQLIFFDPVQVDGDWMNCSLEMYSLADGHIANIGLYITESDDLGSFINTFCGSVRTTMYPTIKNPFAMYHS